MTLPALATLACRRADTASSGYAFIANQDGGGIAAIDLDILAVAKHIPIEGALSQVLASATRPAVYALTPASGTIHEIHTGTLKFARKVTPEAHVDQLLSGGSPGDPLLYAVSREAQSVAAIDPETFRVTWKLHLPEEPNDFTMSGDGKTAAVSSPSGVRLVSLRERSLGEPLGRGNFGQIRFLNNGERLVAADLDRQQISVYRVLNPRLIAHLPIGVRPENLCFNSDGGQLFVTGPGADTVVILYPFDLPEVAETILVGHGPAAMSASKKGLLFITNPTAGSVTVLHVGTHKVISVVPVGGDPGSVGITPDDQLALVLNRESGNVAVLNIDGIQPNRSKSAPLVTIIPVGARPVSSAMHG
ncbi:MAG: YncE family protein [Acidobacteriota bacterium]